MTLLVKFTADKLDHSLFVAGLLIPLCFWFLDAVGYYYQVKLRGTMESITQRIISRNGPRILAAHSNQVIAQERLQRPLSRRVLDSAANHSMWLYALMVLIDVVVWWLYIRGIL